MFVLHSPLTKPVLRLIKAYNVALIVVISQNNIGTGPIFTGHITPVCMNSVSYTAFPSSLMLFFVEDIKVILLVSVMLKIVGHPDLNAAIYMLSSNLDGYTHIELVCRVKTCDDIQ